MNLITCPNHNGIIIENHPCPKCGHPQVAPQGREPYRHLWAIKPPEQGVEVEESTSTSTVDMEELKPGECRMTFPDGTSIDMGGIDMETGEYKPSPAIARLILMTLDPVMFPSTRRTNVPMVKVAFSGSVEMTQEVW